MTTHDSTTIETPDNTPDNADFLRLFEAVDNIRTALAEALPTLYKQFEIILCASIDMSELYDNYNVICDMFNHLRYPNSVDYDALHEAYKVARAKLYRAMPYPEYLKTDHWQDLRDDALERAGRRCQVCNTSLGSLHVHHRSYDRRGQEAPEDLIVLCADCHRVFHENREIAS